MEDDFVMIQLPSGVESAVAPPAEETHDAKNQLTQAMAPVPPQIEHTESASTASLVDVDTPSVRTVPSDFMEQDIKTETQQARIELEDEVKKAKKKAAELEKKAAAKAKKADNAIVAWFQKLTEGQSAAVVGVNAAAVLGVSAFLTYRAIGLYERGVLTWQKIGMGVGILAATSVVPSVVAGYFYRANAKKN